MRKDLETFIQSLPNDPGSIAHLYPTFEDTKVGRLGRRIFEADEQELDGILAKYEIPSPSELGKPFTYIQTTPGHYLEGQLEKNDIIFIPVGATENHGPHLPSGVDNFFVTQILEGLRRFTKKQGRPVGLTHMPTVCGAHPAHHLGMPGTVIIEEDTMKELLINVMLGLWNAGWRKQILVNNHGQFWVLETAIQQFMKRYQLPGIYIALDWHKVARTSFRTKDRGGDFDTDFVHADESETAVMRLLLPEMVDMKYAVDTEPCPLLPVESGHADKSVKGFGRPFDWSSVINALEIRTTPEGIVGKATLGDPKKAKRPVAHILEYLRLLADDILETYPPGKVPDVELVTCRTTEEMKSCLQRPPYRDARKNEQGWEPAYFLSDRGLLSK